MRPAIPNTRVSGNSVVNPEIHRGFPGTSAIWPHDAAGTRENDAPACKAVSVAGVLVCVWMRACRLVRERAQPPQTSNPGVEQCEAGPL
jgi:hypothetical protein